MVHRRPEDCHVLDFDLTERFYRKHYLKMMGHEMNFVNMMSNREESDDEVNMDGRGKNTLERKFTKHSSGGKVWFLVFFSILPECLRNSVHLSPNLHRVCNFHLCKIQYFIYVVCIFFGSNTVIRRHY